MSSHLIADMTLAGVEIWTHLRMKKATIKMEIQHKLFMSAYSISNQTAHIGYNNSVACGTQTVISRKCAECGTERKQHPTAMNSKCSLKCLLCTPFGGMALRTQMHVIERFFCSWRCILDEKRMYIRTFVLWTLKELCQTFRCRDGAMEIQFSHLPE